jgi:predicted O-methyltransferase YrrM
LDAVADFELESVDLIYIDGCHDEIIKDIRGWFSRVKIGGVIAGHDYIVNIKHRINRSLKVPDSVYKDSSWAIVKTPDLIPKK